MKVPPNRFPAGAREAWGRELLRLVRTRHPSDQLGMPSYGALRAVMPEAAERFLLEELDYSALRESDIPIIVTYLGLTPSAEALSRLEMLAQRHESARTAWVRAVGLDWTTLTEVAGQWRRARSSGSLSRLWWGHIVHLRQGTPAKELLQLLGDPSRAEGRRYWYQAMDADVCLFLEEDEQGCLVTWKLGS
jgi:hypothetical protein